MHEALTPRDHLRLPPRLTTGKGDAPGPLKPLVLWMEWHVGGPLRPFQDAKVRSEFCLRAGLLVEGKYLDIPATDPGKRTWPFDSWISVYSPFP